MADSTKDIPRPENDVDVTQSSSNVDVSVDEFSENQQVVAGAGASDESGDDALEAVHRVEHAARQMHEDVFESIATEAAAPLEARSDLESTAHLQHSAASMDDDAAENDALFDSDFDAVEDVLQQVFNTKASLVQHGQSTTISVRSTSEQNEPPEPAETGQPTAAENVEIDISAVDATPEFEASAAQDETIEPVVEETIDDDASADAALLVEETDGQADDANAENEAADETESYAPAHPRPSAETMTNDATADIDEPVSIIETPQGEKVKTSRDNSWARVMAFMKQISGLLSFVKPALVRINAPLKFVPQPLRPLVDYFALTLIMWVPIVWAIAWLVRK